MFRFNYESTEEVIKHSFNSNFDCTCQINTYDQTERNHLLNYNSLSNDDLYGPDPDNLINKNYNLNVHFNYYTVHEFHKIAAKSKKNIFSLTH